MPINLFTSQKLTPPWHLPYMDIGVTKQNNRPNSRDENVFWRHVCINIMNTDDSQVTWLGHVTDVILGANPVLSLFWLAPECTKFSIYSGRNLPLRGAFFQLRSDVQRSVKSLHPFSSNSSSSPVQYSLSGFVFTFVSISNFFFGWYFLYNLTLTFLLM